ncbi:hypothetical protein DFH06DRAFT_1397258 [Mycena polygramma]|nr:hypothetical protein DFH06DRAFT_1397258 [Mycena polygramma]
MGGFLTLCISRSVSRLLDTKGGDFAIACGLAFGGIGLYDVLMARDSCGECARWICPLFSHDPVSVARLRREEPVEVAACWNGAAVYDADCALIRPELTFWHSGPTRRARASSRVLHHRVRHHLRIALKRLRIYVNPQVNVAYTPHNRLYYGKLKQLRLTRVVREDWIAHGMFWWVSDYFRVKEEAYAFERAGVVRAGWCAGGA